MLIKATVLNNLKERAAKTLIKSYLKLNNGWNDHLLSLSQQTLGTSLAPIELNQAVTDINKCFSLIKPNELLAHLG